MFFTVTFTAAGASARLGLPALGRPHGGISERLALVATFVPGTVGAAGVSLSGALLVAYFFAGLALMHFIARTRARWILWVVYAGVILVEPYTAILLMLGGLLEPVLKLKQRFGTPPPST